MKLIFWYHKRCVNTLKILIHYDLTKSCFSKRFKVRDRPLDFNVAEYKKFIDRDLDSTVQLTFKKLFVEFWCGI